MTERAGAEESKQSALEEDLDFGEPEEQFARHCAIARGKESAPGQPWRLREDRALRRWDSEEEALRDLARFWLDPRNREEFPFADLVRIWEPMGWGETVSRGLCPQDKEMGERIGAERSRGEALEIEEMAEPASPEAPRRMPRRV